MVPGEQYCGAVSGCEDYRQQRKAGKAALAARIAAKRGPRLQPTCGETAPKSTEQVCSAGQQPDHWQQLGTQAERLNPRIKARLHPYSAQQPERHDEAPPRPNQPPDRTGTAGGPGPRPRTDLLRKGSTRALYSSTAHTRTLEPHCLAPPHTPVPARTPAHQLTHAPAYEWYARMLARAQCTVLTFD